MSDTKTKSEQNAASGSRLTGLATAAALLIAVVAALLAAWAGWQLLMLRALPERVSNEVVRVQELSRRVDMLAEDALEQREDMLKVRGELQENFAGLADIPARFEQLEQQVAAIPGINQQSRSDWLKTEALYYMRIANAQALLAGDSEVAASALRLADDKLRQAADPSMAVVRASLANEIAALDAMPVVDRAGISFQLQSLTTLADKWPLRATTPANFAPQPTDIDPVLSAWDRFVATLKNVFFRIVSIKETDQLPIAQLSSAEQALIVESIKAELQVARLAFATGNADLFSGSLERAASQIGTYFDTDAASVQSALNTLAEIQKTDKPARMPDISGSLALMLAAGKSLDAADAPLQDVAQ